MAQDVRKENVLLNGVRLLQGPLVHCLGPARPAPRHQRPANTIERVAPVRPAPAVPALGKTLGRTLGKTLGKEMRREYNKGPRDEEGLLGVE